MISRRQIIQRPNANKPQVASDNDVRQDKFRYNRRLAALARLGPSELDAFDEFDGAESADEFGQLGRIKAHQRDNNFKFFKSRALDDDSLAELSTRSKQISSSCYRFNANNNADKTQVKENEECLEEVDKSFFSADVRRPSRRQLLRQQGADQADNKLKTPSMSQLTKSPAHEAFELTAKLEANRNFDPYSVYGEEDEEEDVWYSEERLFEVSFCYYYY